ncbi:hypothetical protein L218DRAFT_993042 [Marasmius fiardii PR-910]|nr:hypothetical protein L218DRAFT_993042 [Marasmius fiardii PR-910]
MVKQINNILWSFIRKQPLQHRTLHSTSLVANASCLDASSKPSSRKSRGVQTKKNYADLPKRHVNPDGTIAAPLENWWGGEHGTESQLYKAVLSVSDIPNTMLRPGSKEAHTESIKSGEDETPLSPVNDIANITPDEHRPKDNTVLKSRRGRKPKSSSEALTNIEVKTTTKKRGRKAVCEKKIDSETVEAEEIGFAQSSSKAGDSKESEYLRPQNTLAKEILENISKFPHCVLLTRVGQFYESYFEQAIEVASLLNIKLAKRKWGGQTIAMCGFPLPHLDKYLKILVQQNKRFVAVCEEFLRYHSGGKREFERRVVRVITPGTLIDESFLNQYENNFLLAVASAQAFECNNDNRTPIGLAWIDVSTGEFFTKVVPFDSLRDEIARIGPREVLLRQTYEKETGNPLIAALEEADSVISFVNVSPAGFSEVDTRGTSTKTSNVADEIILPPQDVPASTPDVYSSEEGIAISLLTRYLQDNLLEHMPTLLRPNREHLGGRMQIDSHTIKALEIRESMSEGVKGSLMSVIKRTLTTSGTRLLSRWLCSPSTSIEEINARQSLVAFFHGRPHFRSDLRVLLTQAEDAGRIVQKFLLGRGGPSDLLSLATAITTWTSIAGKIQLERKMESSERSDFNRSREWTSIDTLLSRLADLEQLANRIGTAIVHGQLDNMASFRADDSFMDETESSALTFNRHDWRYGRTRFGIKINPQFSDELRQCHSTLQGLLEQKEKLEERLQLKYDAPSLSLRSSPAQGMHIHLAKFKRDQGKIKNDPVFVSISETGTTKCYFYQEWSQLGTQIFNAALALSAAERDAFEGLRQEITSHASNLRRNARVLDELDVTLAFADLAAEMNFVRPTLIDEPRYHTENGRHPSVELGLLTSGKVFTPNSVQLTPTSNLHIITGPNMAGKSTLLRQTALITILAQTGSFVPADSATIGIVDKLFSRVGAKDDLFHDRSTFMVEMLETAEILRRATPRSLVIMDEVGRGTTVNDGLAIAFAAIHHLVSVNQCRALFATHFHELSDMLGFSHSGQGTGIFRNVAFYYTEDGYFAYSYRLRRGVNRDSHGLKVAQLAGMPEAAISVARDVLEALRKQKLQNHNPQQLTSLGQLVTGQEHRRSPI